jgi:predicted methyltransferase
MAARVDRDRPRVKLRRMRSIRLLVPITLFSLGFSLVAADAFSAATKVPAPVRSAVDAADRSPEDKALDAGRKPAEMLTFAGVAPGMKVADLGAGGGYTTELLERVVGDKGTVYAQNSPDWIAKFLAKPWGDRLAKPVMKSVVRVDRPFDDPLPPEAKNLDVVVFAYIYHDTVNDPTIDRAKMNAAVFAALKPGGVFLVADHSAQQGHGISDTNTLHRIDEQTVVDEVTKAGFKLDGKGDFLRNPKDTRDWNDSPRAAGERRGTSDRFVLRFKKPK